MNAYGKRPMWQWVVLYVVIGAIAYGLIYYFVMAKQGGYSAEDPTDSEYPSTQQNSY